MISEIGKDLYWYLSDRPKWLVRIQKVTDDTEEDLAEYGDYILSLESERARYEREVLKPAVFDFKTELFHDYPELRSKETSGAVTEEMIVRAREVDITNLIDHKRMWAKCPFHNDTNASLYLKNNFAHCFSCGTSADTIDLVKQIYNVDFKTAVKVLNNL